MNRHNEYECAIVGGGPAGLSAALVLGRARRRTLLLDEGTPRNRVTKHSHGFLTRDGISPADFRAKAHEELGKYSAVECRADRVIALRQVGPDAPHPRFVLSFRSGGEAFASKVILATGLRETLPAIPGLAACYGTSVFSCPYCDGFEMAGKPLAILADDPHKAAHMAQTLSQWSRDLLVCTNGRALPSELESFLRLNGIAYRESAIHSLTSEAGRLQTIRFADGTEAARFGGIAIAEWEQASDLHVGLGCKLAEDGGIETDAARRSSVEGVFAAGDAAIIAPAQLIVAAAEGSRAAIAVNSDLTHESFHPPVPPFRKI
ncbi:NAD(P)/FAD-dependent oxidoreductase [Cohnella fermenti]|uniref:NAD(P)/FAD-dependent oxidoreductase n=1 Tax=Cohnella fermenti TaxID=2565925 RepID=A0A4S4BMI6_9BACL|nr:NAD(P)/FAD-dependent oxidoreductase [Cohnella fermenti]THF75102.1 NAD(P)/FAD-dependent oxidoreductase [Cohnella fermenti]